ncbi:MAG: asparaginase [Sphingobacteriaceae bacterium]|jgi:L-asparaginase|nr:asparaginase [Sphingobacteriaceae bacterium]
MPSKLIIHGGFFSESGTNHEIRTAKQQALKDIATKAHGFLLKHTAVETVAYAVSLLESCELFNAGLGSQIQSDGKIRMSASLMDGLTQKFSGVINIEDVEHPIHVAKKLMEFEDSVLGGPCATSFAREHGFDYFYAEIPQRRKEFQEKLEKTRTGTVGCVALDGEGRLAAATSTGGKGFEMPGRISDSATVAGNYANRFAAVSCTGVGEDIVSGALAAKIVTRTTDGLSLREAMERSFGELKPFDGFAGAIAISANGDIWHQDSHPYMVWASFDSEVNVFD